MFLSSAIDWLEDRGAAVGHAIETEAEDVIQTVSGVLHSATDEIEGGISAVHDDALAAVTAVHDDFSDVVHWGGTQVEKGEDLFASVLDRGDDLVEHGMQEMGDLADKVVDDSYSFGNNLVDKGSGILSTPLVLLAGGALLFLYGSGRNSAFRYG